MYSGFINLNKGSGYSSNKCLFSVKKALRQCAIDTKVGHLGTLDPLACGVLPVALGRATRLFDISLQKTKKYIARFTFGVTSDSFDLGTPLQMVEGERVTSLSIKKALPSFLGEIDQIPPLYSAKSVHGVKAYRLARKGEKITLPSKKVTLYDFSLLHQTEEQTFEFEITCSSGTYIRSLARDLGEAVSSSAVMSYLCRTQSGPFTLENAVSEEELLQEGCLERVLLPMDTVLHDFPKLLLPERTLQKAMNGLHIDCPVEGKTIIYDENNVIIGIADRDENGLLYLTTRLL